MRVQILLFALCSIPTVMAAPASKHAFTIEDFYRIRGVEDVSLSPDGKSVLFAVSTTDLPKAIREVHIWRMDASGERARQLTSGSAGETSPRFSPDGKSISFISSADGVPNLYLMSAEGGTPRRLTSISTGVSAPVWSSNGRWIAFASDVYPECAADDVCNRRIEERWKKGPIHAHLADRLLYRHLNRWKDGKRSHILLLEVSTGAVRDLTPGDFDAPTFQSGGPAQFEFSPDSTELAFDANHDSNAASSTNSDVWSVPVLVGGQPRNLTASNRAFDGNPKYSPDGKYIAYRLQTLPGNEADLFRLAIYDRSTGTSKVLTESFRDWVQDFYWAPDSSSIFFSASVEADNPIFRLKLATGSIQRISGHGTIESLDISRDGRWMVYARSSVSKPVEIFKADLAADRGASPQQISQFNLSAVNEMDIRPAETLWVKGAGNAQIQVFVVKPHNFDPTKKYPLILSVHGGPENHWTDSFSGDWQIYPGAGYIVAFANPHGSTGYGQDFTAEIAGDWGGMVYEDLIKVSDELAKQPYVDSARMGAMGWSYGGYMMAWFEGHTNRFKALAATMGGFDLRSFYGETDELWFPEWDMKGQPWNSADYEHFSPSYYVNEFKTPCLVIASEGDFRITYTQPLQFFTALQKMNVPSRLISYSQAGHWPNWYELALYYTAHLEWFHEFLGGSAPPWTTEQFLRNSVFDPVTGRRSP